MLVEKTFDTGEAVLNYAEGPDNGPPLLFLHGGVGQWKSYEEMLPHFTDRYHVFAPDFRGRGKSTRTPDTHRLKKDVDDTTKFITECIGKPANVFGYSLGGWVAALSASAYNNETFGCSSAANGFESPENHGMMAQYQVKSQFFCFQQYSLTYNQSYQDPAYLHAGIPHL